MGNNPCLVLEVDEHSADAGMTTRVEAFVDTLGRAKKRVVEKQEDLRVVRPTGELNIFKPSKKLRDLDKTLYLSHMSGHCLIMAAAFKSVGIDARVMPQPDELSEELGRRYTSGKECRPYVQTTGDLVRMTQLEDFDPDRSAFVMFNFDGSCRLTQYAMSQKLVLKRLGLSHIPVIAPVTSIRRDEFARLFGLDWERANLKGWLAVDVLLKKLLHTRPYEINCGETERVYERAVEEIAGGIINGNFMEALTKSLAAIDSVPVKREERPIIGIVGEFYSCIAPWENNEIIKELESLGVEVRLGPTVNDYAAYFNEMYPKTYFDKNYLIRLYFYLRKQWYMSWRRKIEQGLGEELQACKIPSVDEVVKAAAPYVSDAIDPVVSVNIAKAETYAARGYSGIANLIVLNCLYGTLCSAIYKKVQGEHSLIPMLNMIYDGLKHTNEKTRIEAFVYQAKLYQERFLCH
jgi:predicted nucleotide-binding protein (sugar kinase/HSP70/actin superfamily)